MCNYSMQLTTSIKLVLLGVSYTYKKVYLNRYIYIYIHTNVLAVKGAKHYYMLVITIIFNYREINNIKTKLIHMYTVIIIYVFYIRCLYLCIYSYNI